MSGISVTGQLINVFDTSNSPDEAKKKLQILAEIPNQNGDVRMDLHDITCSDEKLASALEAHRGKEITLPIRVFSPHDRGVIYLSVLKGATLADIGGISAGDAKPVSKSS